jgi:hypothetical protein
MFRPRQQIGDLTLIDRISREISQLGNGLRLEMVQFYISKPSFGPFAERR